MKLTTIVLATALSLTSTLALAQAPGLGGYGSVVAPFSGFVRVAFRGFVKCGPYVEEHWSRSASASRPHCR
jgi:hypothetical protein